MQDLSTSSQISDSVRILKISQGTIRRVRADLVTTLEKEGIHTTTAKSVVAVMLSAGADLELLISQIEEGRA